MHDLSLPSRDRAEVVEPREKRTNPTQHSLGYLLLGQVGAWESSCATTIHQLCLAMMILPMPKSAWWWHSFLPGIWRQEFVGRFQRSEFQRSETQGKKPHLIFSVGKWIWLEMGAAGKVTLIHTQGRQALPRREKYRAETENTANICSHCQMFL